MDKSTFTDIQLLSNESSSWESSLMIDDVNICPFLSSKSPPNFQRDKLFNKFSSYQFPSKYTGNSLAVTALLKKHLSSSAIQCGFKLIVNKSSPPTTQVNLKILHLFPDKFVPITCPFILIFILLAND